MRFSRVRMSVKVGAMLLLASAFAVSARLESTAVQNVVGGITTAPWPQALTAGFEFSITQSISVTDLGIMDVAAVPLTANHSVGLWDVTSPSTPLASVTIAFSEAPVSNTYV